MLGEDSLDWVSLTGSELVWVAGLGGSGQTNTGNNGMSLRSYCQKMSKSSKDGNSFILEAPQHSILTSSTGLLTNPRHHYHNSDGRHRGVRAEVAPPSPVG
ncbi:hypothetical protein E2C01_052565 [Portunus trituberculatus]|uniref:Uncharacterized protein n=1 Tax=Portunus trituberculatus TaxID=210409 RepID=A0A5B7GE31_PORTR|nr:hypothetical protein [Portunus trituberculatus]